jgi:hypothetical protein
VAENIRCPSASTVCGLIVVLLILLRSRRRNCKSIDASIGVDLNESIEQRGHVPQ